MEYEKLRNEFFEKHTVKDKDGIPKVHTHPHNLFEWFKKQLCEYNVSGRSEQLPILDRCGCEEPNEEPIKVCMNCNG